MSSIVVGERLPEIVATMIEREDGLPCGGCGGHHVRTAHEMNTVEHPCACWCCHGALVEAIEADFPDLISTRGGVRVVTGAGLAEAIRRMEAEIAPRSNGARPPSA